ncbi:GPI-anchored surface protein, putative [Bodo saltans]|uniref:GPI-anchored surface protein, putative n=1 Tax=Bodo saltans TaxID=75058 RepID=A0A0S4IS94_BODSA|nr:GPI-anchored surface protein, putative [Bodo saltans]|eukprot:CUE71587.1 GPI-anchored surface protein, putative [Bodo saltans]
MKHNYDSPSTPGKGSPAGVFTATPQGSIKSSLVALPFWYQLIALIVAFITQQWCFLLVESCLE